MEHTDKAERIAGSRSDGGRQDTTLEMWSPLAGPGWTRGAGAWSVTRGPDREGAELKQE